MINVMEEMLKNRIKCSWKSRKVFFQKYRTIIQKSNVLQLWVIEKLGELLNSASNWVFGAGGEKVYATSKVLDSIKSSGGRKNLKLYLNVVEVGQHSASIGMIAGKSYLLLKPAMVSAKEDGRRQGQPFVLHRRNQPQRQKQHKDTKGKVIPKASASLAQSS